MTFVPKLVGLHIGLGPLDDSQTEDVVGLKTDESLYWTGGSPVWADELPDVLSDKCDAM